VITIDADTLSFPKPGLSIEIHRAMYKDRNMDGMLLMMMMMPLICGR